ncbi:MAG TPA: hypothetical protein VJ890_26295 [Vineibacter sp.]|nr:hypothetical protein [Vineibacter sp.]
MKRIVATLANMRVSPIVFTIALGLSANALAQSWERFPTYPGGSELCHQRVYGNTAEIHWTAYIASDPPQAVTAYYEARLGKPETVKDEARFRAKREGVVERVLSVHPVDGSYPRCGKAPDPSARTVLIVSRMTPR